MADVLDAYALVALIVDEPAAPTVEEILRSGEAVITSINLAEAVDVACRVHKWDEHRVREVVEHLVVAGSPAVIAPGEGSGWRAAQLRCTYYDRRSSAVSIADCFLLAAAGANDRVATADPSIVEIARAEGIEVLPLPDSAGRLP